MRSGSPRPDAAPLAKERLARFLAEGQHGDMAWMAAGAERRGDPRVLWPQVRSVIMLGLNYGGADDPLAILRQRDRGAISVYARGDDYHEIIKPRLKRIARWLLQQAGGDVKVFVDTAAVMEKPLAQAAGLGWQGKHTNLVSRELGSWLFLGAIFTTLELPPDAAETDHCGSCRACLDICPTAAFPAPYRLDARRCISYLTIEHKGPIPRGAAPAHGQPHLRLRRLPGGLSVEQIRASRPRGEARGPRRRCRRRRSPISRGLDEAAFRALFAKSPVQAHRPRPVRAQCAGRDRQFGGSGARRRGRAAARATRPPLVRGAAVWALGRLDRNRLRAAAAARRAAEDDPTRRRTNGRRRSGLARLRPQNSATAASSRSMSSGRDSRWSPSLTSVSTTSSAPSRAVRSTACCHGTSGSCTPCRMRTGQPVSIMPPSSRCRRPSSIRPRVIG